MKRIWKDKEIAYIVEWGKNHKDRLKKYHKKWREKNNGRSPLFFLKAILYKQWLLQ